MVPSAKTRLLQPPERPRFFTRDRGADRPLIDCTASPRLTAPASAARTPKGGIFRASRAPSRQRPDPAGPVKGHSRRVKVPSPMTSARQNFKSGYQTVLKSGAAPLRGLSADIYRSCGKRVAVDPLDGRCLECLCAVLSTHLRALSHYRHSTDCPAARTLQSAMRHCGTPPEQV
jgi:hypothetical protein